MTPYEKIYKYQRFHKADIWCAVASLVMLPAIIVIVMIIITLPFSGLSSVFDLASFPQFGFVLVAIPAVAILYRLHMKKVVADIEKIMFELCISDIDELNERLGQMNCVENDIYIDTEYFICFRNGKVTKLNEILLAEPKSHTSSSRGGGAVTDYMLRIVTLHDPKFALLHYKSQRKRDNVRIMINLMKETAAKLEEQKRVVINFDNDDQEVSMDEL